jgi:hypothetical protein
MEYISTEDYIKRAGMCKFLMMSVDALALARLFVNNDFLPGKFEIFVVHVNEQFAVSAILLSHGYQMKLIQRLHLPACKDSYRIFTIKPITNVEDTYVL